MTAIDRRRFLFDAAAAGAMAIGGCRQGAAALAATQRVLAAPRAATFRAMARSLRDAPDGRFRAVGAVAAQRRFARWYAGQGAAERAHADAVLDLVGRGRVPGYGRLAREAAVCSSAAAATRAAARSAAVDLVTMVTEPPPAEDEHPPVFALEPLA